MIVIKYNCVIKRCTVIVLTLTATTMKGNSMERTGKVKFNLFLKMPLYLILSASSMLIAINILKYKQLIFQ